MLLLVNTVRNSVRVVANDKVVSEKLADNSLEIKRLVFIPSLFFYIDVEPFFCEFNRPFLRQIIASLVNTCHKLS